MIFFCCYTHYKSLWIINVLNANINVMYFCLSERLWFIKLMWAALFFLRVPNIIKHLVKSFSTVELTAAGKPLEIAIVAGNIIFLLAFMMATEVIIRTLKCVGGREMLRGRICLPPIRAYLQHKSIRSRNKKYLSKWMETKTAHAVVEVQSSHFKETFHSNYADSNLFLLVFCWCWSCVLLRVPTPRLGGSRDD